MENEKIIVVGGRNVGKIHAMMVALAEQGIEVIHQASDEIQDALKNTDVITTLEREVLLMNEAKPIIIPSTKPKRRNNKPPQDWGKYQRFFRG